MKTSENAPANEPQVKSSVVPIIQDVDDAPSTATIGIRELIEEARRNPSKPVIEGVLNEGETVGLHGPPEVFKTVFTLQLADALATGMSFLGCWPIAKPRRVYFFETEMSAASLGMRLGAMYRDRAVPTGVYFATEKQLRRFNRASNLADKFALLKPWVADSGAEVVIIDTCNPFFRGRESPNDETAVGAFFDHLAALPGSNKLFVRHNRKTKKDDFSDPNEKMRGSAQFGEVPDLLIELAREDKRTNEGTLGLSKFRHGSKPDDERIWFDAVDCRLIAVPPVIHVLASGPLPRQELLAGLKARFGVAERTGDGMIETLKGSLKQRMNAHVKVFEIDWEAAAVEEMRWFGRVNRPSL